MKRSGGEKEVLEGMRRVPAAIPPAPDPEREDVEDDREQEQAARGVEADPVRTVFERECCGCHAEMSTSQVDSNCVEGLSVIALLP
jgi:hypothetical protein